MARLSTEKRRELVAAIGERYRSASPVDEPRVLDEFVALTGCHRKHALRVLGSAQGVKPRTALPRERLYDEAVRDALGTLREALTASVGSGSGRCCRRS